MKKICIVGGGTAGWISALFLKEKYPEHSISIIESTKIGIIGAGEGGTPNLKFLLEKIGISENEFIKNVNGTKKTGIKFIGWNENPEYSFIHGFKQGGIEDINFYSYHFNARLLAEFLKDVAIKRGIEYLDREVSGFELDSSNKVNKILFKNEGSINCEFVIDCTGFSRMIIGNIYKSWWHSYEDQLIVNSAIPFFINSENPEENQRTIASAENFGWMWKIPLQDRWGCGYLYNDALSRDQDIEGEILKRFKKEEIIINKKIKFLAGCFKEVWIENCIAVGLSTGFLEPLEATSIMTVIFQLENLPSDIFDYSKRDYYNYTIEKFNLQNMTFIRHHYNCSRNDSIFWKEYKGREKTPELNMIYENIWSNKRNKDLLDIFSIEGKSMSFTIDQYRLIMGNNFAKGNKSFI
jgi:tryptophan halogenase